MNRKIVILAVGILCCGSTASAANKSGDNWYFGNAGGLSFATGSPQPLAGGLLSTSEGCATISDSDGNLLFYTDGITVRNAIHQIMPNGSGLKGDSSSTQSAIIVPSLTSSDIYYIFTADAITSVFGVNYSVVDMSLDSGKGDIDTAQKNVNLMATSSEELTATPNSDNTGYWILARPVNSNGFHAFELTASGVNTTPVISNVGTTTGAQGEVGYLKPSSTGDKLAMAYYLAGKAELYDFDNDTGVVSNAIDLGSLQDAYGVEFSQSGDRLYVSLFGGSIQQFDLTAGDIPASKVQISAVGPAALQLGPDGGIYTTDFGATSLGVISSPETLGVGCTFTNNSVPISGTASAGLPTFLQSFFASATVATVTTTAASSVAVTTATSGGNVTADGGAAVTARGVCWSTSHNPTVTDDHTSNGTGTGSFSSSLTGLTATTTYYVRAYATNLSGTAYGSEVSFTTAAAVTAPTVTTTVATSIAETTATSGGNVTATGGAAVTGRGVCWSTNHNPTTADTHSSDGTGTGSFASSLTGLTGSTLYYIRAFATNSAGTAYGSEVSFTTAAPATAPTVTTTVASSIAETTATSGGNVTATGGASVTARGVCWSTSHNPTTTDTHSSDGTGTGSFTSSLTGLTGGTLYYIRAFATNSAGTAYGSEVSFTTDDAIVVTVPAVTTIEPSDIAETSATAGGQVVSTGNATVTARGVCWADSETPTIADDHTTDGAGTGTFTSSLADLVAGTTYHLRAYATNSAGTAYGDTVTFTTDETPTTADIHVSIESRAGDAEVGDEVEFDIDVENLGDGRASDCILTFEIPENTEFLLLELFDGVTTVSVDVEIDGNTITLNLGDIDPAQLIGLVLKLRVKGSGEIVVSARATGTGVTTEVSGESDAVEAIDSVIRIVTTSGTGAFCGAAGMAPFMLTALLLCTVRIGRRKWTKS